MSRRLERLRAVLLDPALDDATKVKKAQRILEPKPKPRPQMLLWSNARGFVDLDPTAHMDLGFTGFVIAAGRLLSPSTPYDALAGFVERAQGAKLYLGVWLAAPGQPSPLFDWSNDLAWGTIVFPAFARLAADARRLGFDGLAFDQELYAQPTGTWRWDYKPGVDEATVRAKVTERAQGVREAIGDLPLRIYNADWQGSLKEGRQHSPGYDASDFVFHDWFNGLGEYVLYDSMLYKDFTPEAGWTAACDRDHSTFWQPDSWRPFGWLTDGLNAMKQRRAGVEVDAWDKARDPAYVTQQLDAFREFDEFAVFDYNAPHPISEYAPYLGG